MGIFSWFSKPQPTDYETLLAHLSTEIQEAKTHLSEIRLRERRLSLLLMLYGVAAWSFWTGLWYLHALPFGLVGWTNDGVEARAASLAGIALGPIVIWLLNRALHFYFTRQRVAEETHLRLLLTQQRKKVDEIKKATNYDSTRKLIEQYDNQGQMQPQSTSRRAPDTPSPAPRTPVGTPRAPGHLTGAGGTPNPSLNSPTPIPEGLTPDQAAFLHSQFQSIQPVLPTPEKKWYDRMADSILGDDPSQAATSKFALVCGECFRHNGLVASQAQWERMQWICPRCNHMNPAPLSLSKSQPTPTEKAAAPARTPTTPQMPKSSPRPRRIAGEKGTPRSSRLGQEVFSASDEDETMDVDEETK
ncbi:endoplasmic reticulum junction formation protein lunapark, partial [Tremellales sp. Uapishka_1]